MTTMIMSNTDDGFGDNVMRLGFVCRLIKLFEGHVSVHNITVFKSPMIYFQF